MKPPFHLSRKNPSVEFLASALFTVFSVGCATQGYSGPQRPESEISTIYFYSSKPLDTSSLAVDGKTQGVFDLGVKVLPGEHEAYAQFEIKDESCDSYGCTIRRATGKCNATIRATAGRIYAIRFRSSADEAFVTVEDKNSGEISGSGSCTTERTTSSYDPSLNKRH